jgi:hypothetical protein
VWYFHACLQYILDSPPSSFSLSCLPHSLIQFQQVSFFHFHMWIQNTFTLLTFIHPFLTPTCLWLMPTPRKDLLYPPVLHFISKSLDHMFTFLSPWCICLPFSNITLSLFLLLYKSWNQMAQFLQSWPFLFQNHFHYSTFFCLFI